MKKIHLELLFTWMLMSAPLATSLAAEGMVVDLVPPGVTDEAVMATLRQALAKQHWNVIGDGEAGAIIAEKSDSDTRAKVEFMRVYQSIRYREIEVTHDFVSAGFGPANTGNRMPVIVNSSVPKRWLSNLQDDMSSLLATQRKVETAQVAVPKAAENSKSVKTRLEQLKELLDAKLISESEYEQKRQQILKEL